MDKALQEKWAEALRSGTFKQSRNQLVDTYGKDGIEYCCLGVLCEITDKPATVSVDDRFGKRPVIRSVIDSYSHVLDMGMTVAQRTAFVNMNDYEQLSFAEIADRIPSVFKEVNY